MAPSMTRILCLSMDRISKTMRVLCFQKVPDGLAAYFIRLVAEGIWHNAGTKRCRQDAKTSQGPSLGLSE